VLQNASLSKEKPRAIRGKKNLYQPKHMPICKMKQKRTVFRKKNDEEKRVGKKEADDVRQRGGMKEKVPSRRRS